MTASGTDTPDDIVMQPLSVERADIAAAMIDLEAALRQLGLWQEHAPPSEALSSTQPFALDTLDFQQWLQFMFLPGLRNVITQDLAMPAVCSVLPMAEETFKNSPLPVAELLAALATLDAQVTAAD